MSSLSVASSLSSVALHPNSTLKPSFDGSRIQFPIRTHRSVATTSSSRSRSLSVVVKAKLEEEEEEEDDDEEEEEEEVEEDDDDDEEEFEFMFDEEDDEIFIKRIKSGMCEWNAYEMRWFGERLLRVLDKKPSERNEEDKKFENLVTVMICEDIVKKLEREGKFNLNDYPLPPKFVEDCMKDYDKFYPF